MMMRALSAAILFFTSRAPGWPRARHLHLLREPNCQWCGTTEDVEVHHEIPVHVDKTRELDPTNHITLCMSVEKCHYKKGHLGISWFAYDPDIRKKCEEHKRQRGLAP